MRWSHTARACVSSPPRMRPVWSPTARACAQFGPRTPTRTRAPSLVPTPTRVRPVWSPHPHARARRCRTGCLCGRKIQKYKIHNILVDPPPQPPRAPPVSYDAVVASIDSRGGTPLTRLRATHNAAKSALCAAAAAAACAPPGSRSLNRVCGRGGDTGKWARIAVGGARDLSYTGVDSRHASLEVAAARAASTDLGVPSCTPRTELFLACFGCAFGATATGRQVNGTRCARRRGGRGAAPCCGRVSRRVGSA